MRASSENITVEYDMCGQGHETIILLPALGANCSMWQRQIDYLVGTYRVVCCNSAGHDALEGSYGRLSLADIAGGVVAVMDAIGLSYAHVIGISMGGMVGQILAARWPERVGSLVLASTTSTYDEAARIAMRERAASVEQQGVQPVIEATLGRWFTPRFRKDHPREVEVIAAMLASANGESYAAAARAVAEVDTTEQLGGITAPTLVLRGAVDPSIPASSFDLLLERISNATGEQLPAAHLCNIEAVDRFNALVAEFIRAAIGPPSEVEATDLMSPW